ncbi:ATP-dependent DNA helicase [Caerostris darwini]|uniref:ATP-dependent DNA helicase n=1 Tax=Caerostris darwini TaxID=1538125 RepID=A0AAV4VB64_9ARAC|nr:ATP-dependent DNA helicase [Caerostris darwini]
MSLANGLYILNDYCPPAPAKEDDPLTKELKRLESTASDPIFAFLHRRDENYSYQFMYHNVQSLQAHHEDLSCDQSFMHSDLLLLAETWSIRSDRFEFQDFKLCVETHSSLNRTRKPNGVCIYAKKHIDFQGARAFPNYETGVHIAVVYLKNNIRFAVLYAKPGSTVDEILDAVEEAVGDECDEYQTILAGDFNINMNTEDGRTFWEVLRDVYWLHLRTNTSH